ncbi:MAG: hypothetical protein AB8G99_18760 [Planctomycetaceae bacterium]
MRWLFLVCLCCLIGCSTRGNEPLEAELRHREDRISQLESRLSDAERQGQVFALEAESLRKRLSEPNSSPRHEQLAAGLAVEKLEISSLLTGFTDDGKVHAVIRPVDADGDLVKLPGRLEVRLVNLSFDNESAQDVGSWSWDATESREQWSSAAIGAGYVVDLPVESLPDDPELVLHARFVPADGRQFKASRPIEYHGVSQASHEDR